MRDNICQFGYQFGLTQYELWIMLELGYDIIRKKKKIVKPI